MLAAVQRSVMVASLLCCAVLCSPWLQALAGVQALELGTSGLVWMHKSASTGEHQCMAGAGKLYLNRQHERAEGQAMPACCSKQPAAVHDPCQ